MAEPVTEATAHTGDDRKALQAELADIDQELTELFDSAHGWSVSFGRLSISAKPSQQTLFKLFLAFHIVTALGGAVLIIKGSGRAGDLGIALVVGALFGIGAFMAEIWGRTMDKTEWISEMLYGERDRDRFRELLNRGQELTDRLQALDEGKP